MKQSRNHQYTPMQNNKTQTQPQQLSNCAYFTKSVLSFILSPLLFTLSFTVFSFIQQLKLDTNLVINSVVVLLLAIVTTVLTALLRYSRDTNGESDRSLFGVINSDVFFGITKSTS